MRRTSFYYGWVIIGVCFLSIAFSRGLQLTYAIFFVEVIQEFGWNRADTAFIQSANLVISGATGVFVGLLIDRWGTRKVLLAGAGMLAVALLGAASSQSWAALLFWWGIGAGVGTNFIGFVPLAVVLSRWFVRRRGAALGMGAAGVGMGTFVLLPLTDALVVWTDWRSAMRILAAILLVVLVPVVYFFHRDRPEEMGLAPDGEPLAANSEPQEGAATQTYAAAEVAGAEAARPPEWTLRAAMRTSHLWLFFAVFTLTSVAMLMIITHQVAHTLDRGFDRQAGVLALGIMGLMSALGRSLFGALFDRVRRELAVGLSFGCSLAGMVAITFVQSGQTGWLLGVYAVVFGLSFGSRGPMMNAMIAERFSGRHLGKIYGLTSLGVGVGSFIGPWLAGWIFDRTQSYTIAFVAAVGCMVAAWACAWPAAVMRHPAAPGATSPLA